MAFELSNGGIKVVDRVHKLVGVLFAIANRFRQFLGAHNIVCFFGGQVFDRLIQHRPPPLQLGDNIGQLPLAITQLPLTLLRLIKLAGRPLQLIAQHKHLGFNIIALLIEIHNLGFQVRLFVAQPFTFTHQAVVQLVKNLNLGKHLGHLDNPITRFG